MDCSLRASNGWFEDGTDTLIRAEVRVGGDRGCGAAAGPVSENLNARTRRRQLTFLSFAEENQRIARRIYWHNRRMKLMMEERGCCGLNTNARPRPLCTRDLLTWGTIPSAIVPRFATAAKSV